MGNVQYDRDIYESGLIGIIRNGIPAMLNNAAPSIALLLNLAFVSHVGGQNWMAAWSIVLSTITFLQGIFNFLLIVPMAQISHLVGRESSSEKDGYELERMVNLALWMAVFVGSVCAGSLFSGFYFQGGLVFELMGVIDALQPLAFSYMMGRLPSVFITFLLRVCTGILVGKQRLRLVSTINLMISILDVILNFWVLVVWRLELFEAGLATSLASSIGILFMLPISIFIDPVWEDVIYIDDDNDDAYKSIEKGKIEVTTSEFNVCNFLRSSSDVMIRSVLLQSALYCLSVASSRLGPAELAAHQLIVQIWSLISLICDGFADVGTMVGGRLLGAQKYYQLSALTTRLFFLAFVLGSMFAAILFYGQTTIIDMFTTTSRIDMDTREQLKSVWLLTTLMQPINAMVFVSDGVLFGHQAFSFIRNLMSFGVLFVFTPTLALGLYYMHSLFAIWIAKSVLSTWRCTAAIWFCWNFQKHTGQEIIIENQNILTETTPLFIKPDAGID